MALFLARTFLNTGIRNSKCTVHSHFLKYAQKQICAKLSQFQVRRWYTEEKGYDGKKPHCNIGTIGHVDHGKTTLTAAITKVLSKKDLATSKDYNEINNAPEKKARSVTINVSQVDYQTDKRQYSHTDWPTRCDYVKSIITGESQLNGAILVVAATDDAMPQTREHLILSKKIGIEHIVVFINKIDDADSKTVKLVETEIRKLLTETGYDGNKIPVVNGSALHALEGKNNETGNDAIMKLLSEVDNFIPTPIKNSDKPFLMPIEGAYSIPGRDTVVVGTLERGIIKKGMECEFVGINETFQSVITRVEIYNTKLTEAHAGDKLGAYIRGVKRDGVKRGMIMCKPGTSKVHDHVEAQIYILKPAEGGIIRPMTNFMQLEMFSNTWDCTVQVTIPEKNLAMPGEDNTIQLKMFRPMVLEKGQSFSLRDGSITLAIGIISDTYKNLNKKERLDFIDTEKKGEEKKREENDEQRSKNSEDFWVGLLSDFTSKWWQAVASLVTSISGWYYLQMERRRFEKKFPLEVESLWLLNQKTRKELYQKKEDETKMQEPDIFKALIEKLKQALELYITLMQKKIGKPDDN